MADDLCHGCETAHLLGVRFSVNDGGMLDEWGCAEVEGDAQAFLDWAGADPLEPSGIGALCAAATGRRPRPTALDGEARLEPRGNGFEVLVNRALAPARQRLKVAHELGHWWYARVGYRGGDIEHRCDMFAAAVVCPRPAFKSAMRWAGHRVHELAERFHTTQSLALLRVGEVSGRPTMLLRPAGPLVRGEPFEWPPTSTLVLSLRDGRFLVGARVAVAHLDLAEHLATVENGDRLATLAEGHDACSHSDTSGSSGWRGAPRAGLAAKGA